MRSFIAALRTLVLPYGSTAGRRILLDGVNGEIILYDESNNERLVIGRFSDTILLSSEGLSESDPGSLQVFQANDESDPDRSLVTYLESPGYGGDIAWMMLESEAFDGSNPSTLTVGADEIFLPFATLFSVSAGARTILAASNPATADFIFEEGICNIGAGGDFQIDGDSLPRGLVGQNTNSSDVTLSTTAGTFSDIVVASNVPLINGRKYKVTFSGGHNVLIAGSGFATTDAWEFELQRDAGAGYGALTVPSKKRWNAGVAVTNRYEEPTIIGYYTAAATGNVSFKCRAAKVTGAATVTSLVSTNGGVSPHCITVEDI